MDRAARIDRNDEQEADAYRALFVQEVERQRAEYEQNFSPEFRARFPFTVNGLVIHKFVMRQLKARKQHDD